MAANGQLDPRTLTQVDGWAYLAAPTATSWVGFCNDIEAIGYPRPTITAPDGAYRTIQQQHYWKAYWTGRGKPGNAATPGWSNHGWGTAIDIFNVYRYPRHIITPVAARWGFTFNVPSELWHMQHNGAWPTAPASHDATPIIIPELPEETTMANIFQAHWTGTDGKTWRLMYIPGTPWYMEWTEPGSHHANEFAKQLETGSSLAVDPVIATKIKDAAHRCTK